MYTYRLQEKTLYGHSEEITFPSKCQFLIKFAPEGEFVNDESGTEFILSNSNYKLKFTGYTGKYKINNEGINTFV